MAKISSKDKAVMKEITVYAVRLRALARPEKGLPDTKAMNRVFKDVFGVKKAGSRVMSNKMEAVRLLNELGAQVVRTICTDRNIYEVVYNLILCAGAIESLEDKIKRAQKRDRVVKDKWVDNLEDYEKEYKRTVKSLQKLFGVSSKKEFDVLRRFNKARKNGYGYGFGNDWDDYDDSWGYEDPFDDAWDDDFGYTSKKFDRQMNLGFMMDSDDEDFDDVDEDFDDIDDTLSEYDSRLDRIERALVKLASDTDEPKRPRPNVIKKSNPSETNDDLSYLTKSMNKLIDVVSDISTRQDELSRTVVDIYDDLYDDEDDGSDLSLNTEEAAINNDAIRSQLLGE